MKTKAEFLNAISSNENPHQEVDDQLRPIFAKTRELVKGLLNPNDAERMAMWIKRCNKINAPCQIGHGDNFNTTWGLLSITQHWKEDHFETVIFSGQKGGSPEDYSRDWVDAFRAMLGSLPELGKNAPGSAVDRFRQYEAAKVVQDLNFNAEIQFEETGWELRVDVLDNCVVYILQ